MATIDTASNMAKKTENTLTADVNRAYSNRGSKKNECSDGMPLAESRVSATQPICHGSRQREELL